MKSIHVWLQATSLTRLLRSPALYEVMLLTFDQSVLIYGSSFSMNCSFKVNDSWWSMNVDVFRNIPISRSKAYSSHCCHPTDHDVFFFASEKTTSFGLVDYQDILIIPRCFHLAQPAEFSCKRTFESIAQKFLGQHGNSRHRRHCR